MFRFFWRALLLLVFVFSVPPTLAILMGAGPDLTTLPPPGRMVEVGGGVKLNVIEKGNGPALVFVHGLPGIAHDWEPLLGKLSTTNRVIAYDRAGYGYSDKPDRGFEVISDAQRLLELIDGLALDRPTLLGWSYGGGVVQEAARLSSSKVERLVLLAAVGPALNLRGERRNSQAIAIMTSPLGLPLSRWVFAVPPLARRFVRSRAAEAYSTEVGLPEGWLERSYAYMSQWGSQRTFIEEAKRMHPETLKPEEIKVPTLVIAGTNDRLVPAAVAEDLHQRLPRSELILVPGASHMVPVTHAAEVARYIRAFLTAGAE